MNKLFEQNSNLVYRVYHDKIEDKKYAEEYCDDLIQIGMIALWKACNKFDPNKGTKFSTYAYASIYKSMLCFLQRESKRLSNSASFSSPVQETDGVEGYTYEEVIPSYQYTVEEFELEQVIDEVTKEMRHNASTVIDLIRKGYTQDAIAKQLGITQSNVSRILKRFRKKLKNTLFLDK
jgi:RNA polymerase sporulation-specific sigma factor